ncbi:MAG: hypothetical protein ACRC3F_07380, partial [Billgrantia desiderata]
NAAKFYHTTGWHEPATTGELLISKRHWDSLPDDLQMIVRSACQAACLESLTWSEAVNGEALTDLVENHGVTAAVLPDPVVVALREATFDTLETEANADPLVRKIHDSYMAFKAKHDRWAGVSEGLWHKDILARIFHRVSQKSPNARLGGDKRALGVEIGCFLINFLCSGRTSPYPHVFSVPGTARRGAIPAPACWPASGRGPVPGTGCSTSAESCACCG